MAVGLASGVANAIVDALCRAVAWTPPAAFFVKLHIGDPGPAGTANLAGETDRQAATFGAAASGAATNTAALTWSGVSTAETYTYVSYWSTVGPTGGTFLGSDIIDNPNNVTVGSDFVIPAGDLDVSLIPVAV